MIELHHPDSDMTIAIDISDGVAVEIFGQDGSYIVRRDDDDLLAALTELLPLYGWEVVV